MIFLSRKIRIYSADVQNDASIYYILWYGKQQTEEAKSSLTSELWLFFNLIKVNYEYPLPASDSLGYKKQMNRIQGFVSLPQDGKNQLYE